MTKETIAERPKQRILLAELMSGMTLEQAMECNDILKDITWVDVTPPRPEPEE